MITLEDKSNCCGCSACASICPQKCIDMVQDSEGFFYPSVNAEKCVNCGLCTNVCPFINAHGESESVMSFAAKSKSKDIRLSSSSGGVFTHFAESVINNGGIVAGVEMSADMTCAKYALIDDLENIARLRGSKYIQAETSSVYNEIKTVLESGKQVLFCGTPCHVNALKLFLKKDYENLICIDFICHGVPSVKLWKIYLQYVESKFGKTVSVSFRCKKHGWANCGVNFVNNRGKQRYFPKQTDPYMQMFLKNYSLRPSCYECKAKKTRYSDITIADFWGIRNVLPDFEEEDGASLVIVHTKKGGDFYESVKSSLVSQTVDTNLALKKNSVYDTSVKKPKERDSFYCDVNNLSFDKLRKKYVKINLSSEVKRRIRLLLHK